MANTKTERPTYTADYIKGDWDKSVFLDSAHTDNLMTAFIGMGAEFWALKQRVMVMEKLMEAKGILTAAAIESYQFSPEAKLASDVERDGFLNRVYSVLTRETAPVTGPVPSDKRAKPLDHG